MYSRAIYHIDLVNGSDAARADLTGCNMTNSGGIVTVAYTGHGLVNGAVVTVPSGTYAGDWLVKRTDADNFTLHSAPATGIIDVTGTPVAEETFVVGAQTFTFKALRSGVGEVTISSDIEVQAKNIADAINTDINTVLQAFIGNYGYDEEFYHKVIVRAVAPGTSGNSLTFTESATGITVDGSGTLLGGTDSVYSADRSTVSITPRGGQSWTDAFKQGGILGISGDINLIAKSDAPVDLAQNATFTNGSKTVTLTTKVTEVIENCESAWTCSANVTPSNNTSRKQGSYAQNFSIAAGFETGKIAYKTISELNLSGYQKVSFFLYTGNVAIAANTIKICLCSDTDGDVIVDTLMFPAIDASWQWRTMVIDKGSVLGSSIKSVALYADIDPGTITLTIDHIIACNGLSLLSLIGQENTVDGGKWYAIQSIVDTTILIDSSYLLSVGGRGYSGTTDSFNLFYLNPINSLLVNFTGLTPISYSNSSNQMDISVQSKYYGGWNKVSNVQDGETWMGLNKPNSFILGTYVDALMFHKICGAHARSTGLFSMGSGANHIVVYKCTAINCVTGFAFDGSYGKDFIIRNCKSLNNSENYFPAWSIIDNYVEENSDKGVQVGSINTGVYGNCIIRNSTFRNNGTYGILLNGINNKLINVTTLENSSYGIAVMGNSTGEKLIVSETVEVFCGGASGSFTNQSYFYSKDHDNTIGNHQLFSTFVNGGMQTIIKHDDDPVSWKINITDSKRNIYFTFPLKVGEHLLEASTTYTFTARIKLAHATNVGARLICKPQTGITTLVSSTKAANTDWEDVIIQVTPSVTAVIEFYVDAYYLLSTTDCTVYVGRTLLS